MDKIHQENLKKFNGQIGPRTYIASRGKVYDVSKSCLWRGGKHWVLHEAGQDLTEALREAPHNEDLLERVPLIGILTEDGSNWPSEWSFIAIEGKEGNWRTESPRTVLIWGTPL